MRYGIISDIHGNYEALKSVMNDMKLQKVERIFCLGDVVGYGPQPHECIQLLREKKVITILGNHDAGVIGKTDWKLWREEATRTWQDAKENLLTVEDIQWLNELPETFEGQVIYICHGSPYDPLQEYIHSYLDVLLNIRDFPARINFFGHTHIPAIYSFDYKKVIVTHQVKSTKLTSDKTWCINPGSVGQPRDGKPTAAFCVYDSKSLKLEFRRVSYNVEETKNSSTLAATTPCSQNA